MQDKLRPWWAHRIFLASPERVTYIPHINSIQLTMSPQALVYICFTLMTCSWLTMPATLHMYVPLHINFTLLFIQALCCDLSSNMHMCYAFGNHICPLPSMNTYVFLVWQIYFVFYIYANNFGNYTYRCVMPMKYWKPQFLNICKPYLFYDTFRNPCLAVHICFCKYLWSVYYNL